MKLNISKESVDLCRQVASEISREIQKDIHPFSTVSVERAILRLLGVRGEKEGVPMVNVLVDRLREQKALEEGVFYWVANACLNTSLSPQEVAERTVSGDLNLLQIPRGDFLEVKEKARELATLGLGELFRKWETRMAFKKSLSHFTSPLLYVIVASGNIYDDIAQARTAALEGADCIAVIRSTAQSLLDYVPEGITTEGYGGTFATQENFRLMRQALDDVSSNVNRYIHQVNYCSGLCMAEIAALAIIEGLDIMVNDALYGILFRDLNMYRTMIDQHFSRYLLGLFGIIITTGEDNLIKTVDAFKEYGIVLASQFLNEQLAEQAGMKKEQIGLGHAAELDPKLPDSLLWELVHAQLVRQVFPRSPVKYMPPTRFKSGNIFFAHVLDTIFNLVGFWTDQRIILLGMPTEALHTPYVQDRFISLESALHLRNASKSFSLELNFRKNGVASQRANQVLNDALEILNRIREWGIWNSLSKGVFSRIRREKRGGRGFDGVFRKGKFYLNPFLEPGVVEEARRKRG
ncbi:MAG: lysine 5,6-aminomutase subunit alpha [Caldiserica bacterium]|jgi:beta-lysine 5,6-aminomutase alpha subunit|nr:lysine 5,6-aminomutase subunit alpha [Caldisericota bacterium]MDH7562760.1 lysine 5,6-aminomutase subunit alpha [Caldisericota bacterium]